MTWRPASLTQLLDRITRQSQKLQYDTEELDEVRTSIAKRMRTRARYIEALAAAVKARLSE